MNNKLLRAIIFVATITLLFPANRADAVEVKKMAYETFIEHLQEGRVAGVSFVEKVNGEEMIASFVSDGSTNRFNVNTTPIATRSDPLLIAELEAASIEAEVINTEGNSLGWSKLIMFLLPTFLWYAFPLATLILVIMIYRKVKSLPNQDLSAKRKESVL